MRKTAANGRDVPKNGNGTGSLYQRADGLWVAAVSLGNGERVYRYARTKTEAREKLNTALYEAKRGTLVTSSSQTVRELFTEWFENVPSVAGLSDSTLEGYARMADSHILPELGGLQLAKLKGKAITAFYNKLLKNGLAAGSVLNIHRFLHQVLETAVRDEILVTNPSDKATRPKRVAQDDPILNDVEAKQLIAALEGDPLKCYYLMAITMAMRQGEILALTWSDIELKAKVVSIKHSVRRISGKGFVVKDPKTKAGRRTVPIPDFVADALIAHRAAQEEARIMAGDVWADHGLVFCNSLGKRLEPQNIQRRSFQPLLKRAGLKDVTFHSLRKSATSIMLALGVDLKTIQAILGHSTPDLTLDVYAKGFDSKKRAVGKKMNRALRPSPRAGTQGTNGNV